MNEPLTLSREIRMKEVSMQAAYGILVFIIFLLSGCSSVGFRGDPSELTRKGIMYANIGEMELAMIEYGKALEIDPNFAEAYNSLGNAFFVQGKYDLAIEEYKKAIDMRPDYAKAYNNLGYAYFQQKQYVRAISEFSKAIASNAKYARAYNNRGLVYFVITEYDRAISDFNAAIAIEPELAKPYDNRGMTFFMLDERDRACSDLNRACELGECSAYNMMQESGYCVIHYLASEDLSQGISS